MNKNLFQGEWNIVVGKMQQFWGKLTNDDLEQIKGNHNEIFGRLQKHYGYSKEQAEKAIKDFQNEIKEVELD